LFGISKKYNEYSDEVLMQHIVAGKTKAFDELYCRYSTQMHYYFYRLLYQDDEKANDFTQNLFMKIIEKPTLFDNSRKFSTWFYSVATNMCKNEYRRNSRRPTEVKEESIKDLPEDNTFTNGLAYYLPENLDQEIFDQYLKIAIDKLSKDHRLCFVLRYQQELSVNEISEILDCPRGTVKSRLHYAIKIIASKMAIFNTTRKKEHHERKTG